MVTVTGQDLSDNEIRARILLYLTDRGISVPPDELELMMRLLVHAYREAVQDTGGADVVPA